MTLEWIKSFKKLERDPKTLHFKALMRWSQSETVGFLHRFWWWADDVAPDGVVTSLCLPGVIGGALGYSPAIGDKALEMMKQAGWLDILPSGEIVIHNHDKYRSTSKDKKEGTRERVRRHREKKRASNGDVTRYSNAVTPLDEEEDTDQETTERDIGADPPEIPDNLITLAEDVLGATPVGQLRLLMTDGYSPDWIFQAVKETGFHQVRKGMPAVNYARAILRQWAKEGGPPKDDDRKPRHHSPRPNAGKAEKADFSNVRTGDAL